jgi:DNA-3-methyladenine glycosylase II
MSTSTFIHLPFPSDFSWQECLWFLDRGYDDCMHRIDGTTLWKAQWIGEQPLLLKMGPDTREPSAQKQEPRAQELDARALEPSESFARGLTIEVPGKQLSQDQSVEVANWIKEWLDMDRLIEPFYQRLKASPFLSGAESNYRGLRLIGIPDLYEALCWCIIGQQIHLRFAHSMKRQFVHAYGKTLTHQDQTHYLFPEPATIAQLKPEDLYALQFSRQKADYILHISRLFVQGTLSKQGLQSHPNTEEKLKALMAIRGVGPWTAHYVGMKTLRCMECIPYGDAGINQALGALLGLKAKPSNREVDAYFSRFKGWESYLVFYLWRTLYGPPPSRCAMPGAA